MTAAGTEVGPERRSGSDKIRVVPATTAPFADVEAVFGTRGDPAHCWCQWYKIPGSDWRGVGDDGLRGRLAAQLERGAADGSQRPSEADGGSGPGLVAYLGDEPVGWCAVEPRPGLPRLRTSRVVTTGTRHPDFDDERVWAVTCFVVPRAHRRKGVGRALARAAVEYAREAGARVVEAYAIDPGERRVSAADLFHGAPAMFEAAGFTEVARPTPLRVVMEVALEP